MKRKNKNTYSNYLYEQNNKTIVLFYFKTYQMSEFWNQKYDITDYLYGVAPNEFIKQELLKLKPGHALFPAEGEGRNAVYAASIGWEVTAFDPSSVAKEKALRLAEKNNVKIEYYPWSYEEAVFEDNTFDTICLTFAHMPPELRAIMHKKYLQWLKPGGTLTMEAFSKEQLGYNSGGPKNLEMLFSEEELWQDFDSASLVKSEKTIVELDEGPGHQGKASVIRLVAFK